MTISSSNRKAGPFSGNGVTAAFPFTFKVFTAADVLVVKALTSTGVETVLTLTTDYTVSLNADQNATPGGTITMLVAPATGYTLTATSQVANLQPTNLTNAGGFYPAVINDSLDRATIQVQQLAERQSRSVSVPLSSGADPTLPTPKPGHVLGWDTLGAALINIPATPGTSLVDLSAPSGASLVGAPNVPAPAYLKTISDILNGDEVLIDRFLPTAQISAIRDRTSVYDCGPDVAAATLAFTNGGGIYAKQGKYIFNSGFILPSNTTLRGDGYATEFSLPSDIELIKSDLSNINNVTSGVVIKDLYIKKTISGATTKYDIHLSNPENCVISRVQVGSGHNDSAYSATNVGGIWLDKPVGSTTPAFMNLVENCWLQNNSIYFNGVTDSAIRGGYVWGHVRQFAIRLAGGGANAVEKVEGIICSKYNGGIWLDGAGINQCRIIGNEFDGNPLLDTGTGIYAPDSTLAMLVNGNTFWGCDKHGIDTTDPVGWSITGNAFWKNNASDNFYDDVRISGKAFQPNGNVVSGNTHVIDEVRTNKGYAIREVNNGFNPFGNTYSANGVLGSTGYQNPAILVLQTATQVGNAGMGADASLRLLGDSIKLDAEATIVKTPRTAVAATSGTLDLTITTESGAGTPAAQGSYVGTLYVSSSRPDYTPQSRRTVWAVMGYGTTLSATSLAQQDGTGGGPTYTLTSPSNGVIRFNNTFASGVTVDMMFVGTRGYSGA